MCSIPDIAKSSSRSERLAELKAPETQESQGRGREPEVEVGGEERWSKVRGEEKEKESVTISPLINIFSVPTEDTERESHLSSLFAFLSLSLSVANMRR